MDYPHQTISLIGMPGAGKSTVGVLLAKHCGLLFNDSDLDIQAREGMTLQEILELRGHMALRQVEEEVLLAIPIDNTVLSTGGSVVYSEAIMARLSAAGPVVYLNVDRATLEARVAAAPPRGMASNPNTTYADIFRERVPLYERYADITIDASDSSPEAIALRIADQLAVIPATRR